MKNLYVKFEYGEAISGKREFLSSQINLLELLKKFKNYETSRKRELILKSKLKKEAIALKKEIKEIQIFFPKEKEAVEIKPKKEPEEYEESENTDIESQLQEIKEKLAALG